MWALVWGGLVPLTAVRPPRDSELASFHSFWEEVMDFMFTAELLGNFGEFFGAIAVVATLFYLARQIRQNSNQMQIQAGMQFMASLDGTDLAFSRFRGFLITSEEVCAIWNKALDNFDALAGTERTRADQLLFEFFVLYHNFYIRFTQAATNYEGPDVVQELKRLVSTELECQSVRSWWWQNRHRISTPEFVELMSGLVQKHDEQS